MHIYIFKLLKCFPTDGTFDQEGTLETFVKRDDIKYHASYDLSSATDLLPVSLYRALLKPLFGWKFMDNWIALLVDKDFKLPRPKRAKDSDSKSQVFVMRKTGETARYTKGQPMGAYSSWGLLALCHHLCVQVSVILIHFRSYLILRHNWEFYEELPLTANEEFLEDKFYDKAENVNTPLNRDLTFLDVIALIPYFLGSIFHIINILFKKGILPFDKYVLLGDDIVIGDKDVGDTYYQLMNNLLEVPIKLAKSYTSDVGLVNFANKTYFGKEEISPAPSKEFIRSKDLGQRLEFARRVTSRWSKTSDVLMKLRLMIKPTVYIKFLRYRKENLLFSGIIPVLVRLIFAYVPFPKRDGGKVNTERVETSDISFGKCVMFITLMLFNVDKFSQSILSNIFDYDTLLLAMARFDSKVSTPITFKILMLRYLLKYVMHPYLGDRSKSLYIEVPNETSRPEVQEGLVIVLERVILLMERAIEAIAYFYEKSSVPERYALIQLDRLLHTAREGRTLFLLLGTVPSSNVDRLCEILELAMLVDWRLFKSLFDPSFEFILKEVAEAAHAQRRSIENQPLSKGSRATWNLLPNPWKVFEGQAEPVNLFNKEYARKMEFYKLSIDYVIYKKCMSALLSRMEISIKLDQTNGFIGINPKLDINAINKQVLTSQVIKAAISFNKLYFTPHTINDVSVFVLPSRREP